MVAKQPVPDNQAAGVPSRRTVLRGFTTVGALGLATPMLAACGGGSSADSGGGTAASRDTAAAVPSARATSSQSPFSLAGKQLAQTSEVPVGGGIVIDGPIALTQPRKGLFKAFDGVCTHMGCAVSAVTGGFIVCPCHGSRFDISTGQPTPDSPAKAPLGPIPIVVKKGEIDHG
jgi:Rieske Fe-S protein